MSPPSDSRPPSGAIDTLAVIRELRQRLGEAAQRIDDLERRTLAPTRDEDLTRLHAELAACTSDRESLTERLVAAEQQASRLMSLYVATYQLHSTLDPEEVQSVIAEIAVDLVGAESFALLLRDDETPSCRVALARGLADRPSSRFQGPAYVGGDPLVDAALADGQLRIGGQEGSEALAVVPLQVQDSIVGALVVIGLVGHRRRPLSEDRELFDLIAAHAAMALLAARAYAASTRKLRTLEGLLTLLQGN